MKREKDDFQMLGYFVSVSAVRFTKSRALEKDMPSEDIIDQSCSCWSCCP